MPLGFKARFRAYFRRNNIFADAMTLALSYAFILFGTWDDGLLGLEPTIFSHVCEWLLAIGLALSIVMRVIYVPREDRKWHFYPLVAVDALSVMTVVPSVSYVQFAQVVRLVVSGGRTLQLIDSIARRRGNPYLILLVYPFVVPIVAAFFFVIERHAGHPQVHNYFQALVLMMSYSLTVGLVSNHPVTHAGKLIAGAMLLTGLMCVSVVGNALTERYTNRRDP